MIEEQGRVSEIHGEKAIVEIQRQSVCHSCDMNRGCGTGSLGRLMGFRQRSFVIDNDLNLKPGDPVVLGMTGTAFVKAGLLVYLLPLFGLLLGASLVTIWFAENDLAQVIAGAGGLLLGFRVSARLAATTMSRSLQPRIVRRYP